MFYYYFTIFYNWCIKREWKNQIWKWKKKAHSMQQIIPTMLYFSVVNYFARILNNKTDKTYETCYCSSSTIQFKWNYHNFLVEKISCKMYNVTVKMKRERTFWLTNNVSYADFNRRSIPFAVFLFGCVIGLGKENKRAKGRRVRARWGPLFVLTGWSRWRGGRKPRRPSTCRTERGDRIGRTNGRAPSPRSE